MKLISIVFSIKMTDKKYFHCTFLFLNTVIIGCTAEIVTRYICFCSSQIIYFVTDVAPEVVRKPPVPQRKMSHKSLDVSAASHGKAGKKRGPGNDGDSVNVSRSGSQKSSKRNASSPPKPAKRRRVNSQQNGSFTKSSTPKQLVSVTSKVAHS